MLGDADAIFNFTPTVGDFFDLLRADATSRHGLNGVFADFDVSGLVPGFMWSLDCIENENNFDIVRLTISAVPEPGTGVLSFVALILLVMVELRR